MRGRTGRHVCELGQVRKKAAVSSLSRVSCCASLMINFEMHEGLPQMSDLSAYTVFARKYRPQTFQEIVGQNALVQTLSNAIVQQRVAHAYILTGVRGVGKTTTARLIARSLNCTGSEGGASATIDPCGTCSSCVAIANDVHMDVIEIDAASRTGVDDVRALIEGVRYKSVKGRYKIYIIDEVHMLSKSAFNALLKTLEEPPAHVKFLFATTEIRKVPATILSRCQRFDLKRVDVDVLKTYFEKILTTENIAFSSEAVLLISKAADGSVRDGLSLLDQAVSLTDGDVQVPTVEAMLGIATQQKTMLLLDNLWKGEVKKALAQLAVIYKSGGMPELVCQDLLALVHDLSVAQVVGDVNIKEEGRKLSVPVLTRAWQLLLKGLQEIKQSPLPQAALEMVVIRFCYIQDVPILQSDIVADKMGTKEVSLVQTPKLTPKQEEKALSYVDVPQSFTEIISLFKTKREALIASTLHDDVHLVSYVPLNLVMRLSTEVPVSFISTVRKHLEEWTGSAWSVTSSPKEGGLTCRMQEEKKRATELSSMMTHDKVQKVFSAFPEAKIEDVQYKKKENGLNDKHKKSYATSATNET